MRRVLDGIFYVLRTGCPWRMLPREYPAAAPPRWPTVYAYLRRWRLAGVWERVNAHLLAAVRARDGRHAPPSAGVIDSQSAKTMEEGGPRGYDGAKELAGRKRHILVDLVDTSGLLMRAVVHRRPQAGRRGGPRRRPPRARWRPTSWPDHGRLAPTAPDEDGSFL